MAAHTEGPWSAVEILSEPAGELLGWSIGPGDTHGRRYLADVHLDRRDSSDHRPDTESEANARLIARAPELLAENRALRAVLIRRMPSPPEPSPGCFRAGCRCPACVAIEQWEADMALAKGAR